MLDDLDQKILNALMADSSTSTARLGRRFKVARSTVQARIERMENNGTIAAYTIRLGESAAVRRVRATVMLTVETRAMAAVTQAMKSIPEVEVLHSTAGPVAMLAQIAAPTTEELDEVLDQIGQIAGVQTTDSLVHLATRFDRRV